VLIVAKISKGSAGGYADYLEGKSGASEMGDYYLKDGERVEAPGRWAGGAHLFGLDATVQVTGEQLRTLMDVRRPDTSDELRRVGARGEAVAALDATFSAPKSVSAVWALASPELRQQIEAAHEIAIDRVCRGGPSSRLRQMRTTSTPFHHGTFTKHRHLRRHCDGASRGVARRWMRSPARDLLTAVRVAEGAASPASKAWASLMRASLPMGRRGGEN